MSCEHEVRFTIKPTDDACRFHFDVRAYKDRIVAPDEYSGATEVTPSDAEQVLPTRDKLVRDDITVNPAPTETLSATSNGTFTPSDGKVGFSAVNVAVNPDLRPLSVSENGSYQPDGFDGYESVVVDVPATPLIDTIDVFNVQSKEIVIDQNWFSDSDIVVLVPHLEFSTRDWLYVNADNGTNSSYWPGANDTAYGTDGYRQSIFIVKIGSVYRICWFCDTTNRNKPSVYDVTSSFFCRLYYGSSTMTGNIKVYGIKIPT